MIHLLTGGRNVHGSLNHGCLLLDGPLFGQELLLLQRILGLEHSCDEIGLLSVLFKLDLLLCRLALPFEHTLVREESVATLGHLLVLPWATLLPLEHAVGVGALVVALRDR